eukprot:CAMPEP_0197033750 /NCGR_PEP_ID=MMETSP1384-20130603/12076_1 /TAXON_ID=29189 /ORGANISM="Ammonia sp." /LENGTH=178 /DNA_ID=CAMNT_0042463601 /DNA_START=55 /DNA_END=591 /DNA_ORIENTATION=+
MSFSGYKQTFGTQKVTEEMQQEHEKEIQIHSNPLLPDNVDEYGNLPQLTCGWKACSKRFESKEELLEHVKYCMPHKFIDRFHTNCKFVLENHPELTLQEFEQKVRECYPEEKAALINHQDLLAYYNQFQTVFKQHEMEKDVEHPSMSSKQTAEILFDFRIQSQKKLMAQNKIPQQFIA